MDEEELLLLARERLNFHERWILYDMSHVRHGLVAQHEGRWLIQNKLATLKQIDVSGFLEELVVLGLAQRTGRNPRGLLGGVWVFNMRLWNRHQSQFALLCEPVQSFGKLWRSPENLADIVAAYFDVELEDFKTKARTGLEAFRRDCFVQIVGHFATLGSKYVEELMGWKTMQPIFAAYRRIAAIRDANMYTNQLWAYRRLLSHLASFVMAPIY